MALGSGGEKVRLLQLLTNSSFGVTKTSPSGVVSAPFRLPQRPLPPTTSEESSATSTTRLLPTIRTRTFTRKVLEWELVYRTYRSTYKKCHLAVCGLVMWGVRRNIRVACCVS